MSGAKERKERDELITKARTRLSKVIENIDTMKHELDEVIILSQNKKVELDDIDTILKGGSNTILRHRKFENHYDIVSLIS